MGGRKSEKSSPKSASDSLSELLYKEFASAIDAKALTTAVRSITSMVGSGRASAGISTVVWSTPYVTYLLIAASARMMSLSRRRSSSAACVTVQVLLLLVSIPA